MKKILVLLGTLFIMQTLASMADSANDTVWKKKSHYITNMEFAPNKDYFLTRGTHSERKGVIIFNTEGDTVKVIYNCEGLNLEDLDGIYDARFSQDGQYLALMWEYGSLPYHRIELYSTATWERTKVIDMPVVSTTFYSTKVLISPDNRIIVGINSAGLYFFDAESGELINHLVDYGQDKSKNVRIYQAFYSANGQYIYFIATDNNLRFLNTATYQIDYTRQDQIDNVQYGSFAVSRSGNMLANDAGKEELRIINTQSKESILSIPVYTGGINSMVFSPDERYLAVNFGQGKIILVYEIKTGKSVYEYTTVPSGFAMVGIGISFDQKYIVSSSNYIYFYKFLPTTGVEKIPEQKEDIIYPNPTNKNYVTVEFSLLNSGITKIQLYDLTGRIVKNIENNFLDAGNHNLEIDISNLPIGQYYLTIETISGTKSHKILVTR